MPSGDRQGNRLMSVCGKLLTCHRARSLIRTDAESTVSSMVSFRRRLTAVLMAIAILLAGAPMVPAMAGECDHMAMSSMTPGPMAMKSAPAKPRQMPQKPGLPCNNNLSCLGSAGCAALAIDQAAVVLLPRMDSSDTGWPSRIGDPGIAHKPALPPPIAQV